MKKILSLIRNALHVTSGVLIVSDDPKLQALGAGLAAVGTLWSQKNTTPPPSPPPAVPIEVPIQHQRTPLLCLGILVLGCLGIFSSGCSTTPDTAQRVQSAAKVAAYVGTSTYLAEHPYALHGFLAARDSLLTLEQAEQIDFATLLAIVQRLPIKELKSETAVIVITSATILLSDYGGAIPVERLEELRPLVAAIRAGIELGLPAP